jgi:flagellar basal-body rod protein FlgB
MQRPDGNNVSLDRESLLLAQTQLQFRLGVELLRQEFQEITTAIKEGS